MKRCRHRFHGKEQCTKPAGHADGASFRTKASWHSAPAPWGLVEWRGKSPYTKGVKAQVVVSAEPSSKEHK